MNREKIKLSFWGAVVGAIILAIVGFAFGGWVTGGTAEKMAKEEAENAVVTRLAPICVEQFNEDAQRDQKLIDFKAKSSWERDDYVAKQGWATMPGESKPDSTVAGECADLLMALGE